MSRRIVILTLTGGGGHLQAAKAKYEELRASHPDAFLLEQDILFNWVSKYLGAFVKRLWGGAQARGDVFFLVLLSSGLKLADKLFSPPIFISALKTCIQYDIDTIIDTQPLGTSAIIKALRLIHLWKKKKIAFEKVITDLPTKEATHFFGSIKHLSAKDRAWLKIRTTMPILENGETEILFWKKTCNLDKESVIYSPPPLRPSFFEETKKAEGVLSLDILMPNPSDLHLTCKILSYGNAETKRFKDHIHVSISPEEKVTLMMLGANPNPEAVLAYINHFIHLLQTSPATSKRKDLLFVFCSSQVPIKPSLREQIFHLIQKTKNYPHNLTLFAIAHQNDTIIAPLLRRSNATLTKSGGLTSMELLHSARGEIWIHKEPSPHFFLTKRPLHQGMPLWERGNARYLEAKRGAKLVTPKTFEGLSKNYFSF